MDCSPPGPSVHGIFQARVLESVAIAFSIIATFQNNCWNFLKQARTIQNKNTLYFAHQPNFENNNFWSKLGLWRAKELLQSLCIKLKLTYEHLFLRGFYLNNSKKPVLKTRIKSSMVEECKRQTWKHQKIGTILTVSILKTLLKSRLENSTTICSYG